MLVKEGQAVLFPAMPGSGKSTLTAWLGLNGWSVYSDEMAVIDLHTGTVQPMYRPICLKNLSIDLIQKWSTDAILTPVCHDTASATEPQLYSVDKLQTFENFYTNAFNYHVLGQASFDILARVVNQIQGFEVHYASLDFMSDFLTDELLS